MGAMSQDPPALDPTRIVPEGFVFPGTEQVDPRQVFSGPGYQAPPQRTEGAAVAALVCAVLSPIPGFGLMALLLGWYALHRLRGTYATGHAMARFGMVIGAATTVGWLWLWWFITFTS